MDKELTVHQEKWNVMDGPDKEEEPCVIPETVSNSFVVDIREGVLGGKTKSTHHQELGPRHGALPEDQRQGYRYISKERLCKSTSQ